MYEFRSFVIILATFNLKISKCGAEILGSRFSDRFPDKMFQRAQDSMMLCVPGQQYFCVNATHFQRCNVADMDFVPIEATMFQLGQSYACSNNRCCVPNLKAPCSSHCPKTYQRVAHKMFTLTPSEPGTEKRYEFNYNDLIDTLNYNHKSHGRNCYHKLQNSEFNISAMDYDVINYIEKVMLGEDALAQENISWEIEELVNKLVDEFNKYQDDIKQTTVSEEAYSDFDERKSYASQQENKKISNPFDMDSRNNLPHIVKIIQNFLTGSNRTTVENKFIAINYTISDEIPGLEILLKQEIPRTETGHMVISNRKKYNKLKGILEILKDVYEQTLAKTERNIDEEKMFTWDSSIDTSTKLEDEQKYHIIKDKNMLNEDKRDKINRINQIDTDKTNKYDEDDEIIWEEPKKSIRWKKGKRDVILSDETDNTKKVTTDHASKDEPENPELVEQISINTKLPAAVYIDKPEAVDKTNKYDENDEIVWDELYKPIHTKKIKRDVSFSDETDNTKKVTRNANEDETENSDLVETENKDKPEEVDKSKASDVLNTSIQMKSPPLLIVGRSRNLTKDAVDHPDAIEGNHNIGKLTKEKIAALADIIKYNREKAQFTTENILTLPVVLEEKQAEREIEGQPKGDIDGQANVEIEGQNKEENKEQTNGEIEEQSNGEIKEQTNGEIKEQADGEIDRQTNEEIKGESKEENEGQTNGDVEEETNTEIEGQSREDIEGQNNEETEEKTTSKIEEQTKAEIEGQSREEIEGQNNEETEEETTSEIEEQTKAEIEGQSNEEIEGQTNGENDEQTNGDVEEQTKVEIEGQSNEEEEIEEHTKGEIEAETKEEVEVQTDGEIERQTKAEIEGPSNEEVKGHSNEEIVRQIKGEINGQIKGQFEGQIKGEIKGQTNGELEGQIKAELEVQAKAEFEGQIKAKIEGPTNGRFKGQIKGEIEGVIKGENERQAKEEIEEQTKGEIEEQIKEQVEGETKAEGEGQTNEEIEGQTKGETEEESKGEIEEESKEQVEGQTEAEIDGQAKAEIDGQTDTQCKGYGPGVINGIDYKALFENLLNDVSHIIDENSKFTNEVQLPNDTTEYALLLDNLHYRDTPEEDTASPIMSLRKSNYDVVRGMLHNEPLDLNDDVPPDTKSSLKEFSDYLYNLYNSSSSNSSSKKMTVYKDDNNMPKRNITQEIKESNKTTVSKKIFPSQSKTVHGLNKLLRIKLLNTIDPFDLNKYETPNNFFSDNVDIEPDEMYSETTERNKTISKDLVGKGFEKSGNLTTTNFEKETTANKKMNKGNIVFHDVSSGATNNFIIKEIRKRKSIYSIEDNEETFTELK